MEKKFITTWFYASKENETREVGVFKTKQKKFYGERAVDIAEFSQHLRIFIMILTVKVMTW